MFFFVVVVQTLSTRTATTTTGGATAAGVWGSSDGGQSDALPLCSLSHTPSPISMLTKAARALQIKTTTTNMSKTNKKLVSLTHTCTQAPAHAPHTSKLIHTHTLSFTHTRKQAPIDRSHAHFCANFSPTHARALSHTHAVLSCSY